MTLERQELVRKLEERKLINSSCFQKYVFIHSFIHSTHLSITYHVAAILLGTSDRRVKNTSLP